MRCSDWLEGDFISKLMSIPKEPKARARKSARQATSAIASWLWEDGEVRVSGGTGKLTSSIFSREDGEREDTARKETYIANSTCALWYFLENDPSANPSLLSPSETSCASEQNPPLYRKLWRREREKQCQKLLWTLLRVQPVVPEESNTTGLKMPKSHVAFRHWLNRL